MKLILQAIKALFRKIEASRTHWEEVEEVEILAETTVTISADNSDEALPDTTQLTVGKTYFVILNGVSYECVAWYSDDESAVIIGNGDIFGGEGGNGEPFSCDSYTDGEIYLNTEKAGTYTISVSTEENVVHKLDKKYLPDEVIDSIGIANNAQTTAKNAQTTANSKMNASNPVGTGSFSMGRKSGTTIGSASHAEGRSTTASGVASHAEGESTTASRNYSHAEGYKTTASGYYSHAEGRSTTASGISSHAEGESTKASSSDQHVQGKFNVPDSQNKYAHIVGNGTDYNDYSNAHTLDWNGVPWFQGRPQFGGTAQDQDSQTVMANGDKEIILTSSTEGSTKKFKITVDDSGTLTATEVTA